MSDIMCFFWWHDQHMRCFEGHLAKLGAVSGKHLAKLFDIRPRRKPILDGETLDRIPEGTTPRVAQLGQELWRQRLEGKIGNLDVGREY